MVVEGSFVVVGARVVGAKDVVATGTVDVVVPVDGATDAAVVCVELVTDWPVVVVVEVFVVPLLQPLMIKLPINRMARNNGSRFI